MVRTIGRDHNTDRVGADTWRVSPIFPHTDGATTVVPVETRELEYFVAVAEELHFGRAAERLRMSQPPLSRAIQQLERRLGVTLLDRAPRALALTAAGVTLLREGKAALNSVAAAERRTRRAAVQIDRGTLVLVTKAGASVELLAKLLDAYAAEPGAADVEVELCGPGEQEQWLRDGRADVALLHRPFDSTAGFDVEILATEGQVALLPSSHPLSTRAELQLAELSGVPGLPLPRWPDKHGEYPDGPGPQVRNHEQLLQLITLSRALAVLPDSVGLQRREGISAVPVTDAPTVTTVIAWPPQSTSAVLASLVRTAVRL